jgi:hypothetical protein
VKHYRYYIQVRRLGPGREWYWRIMATNGQVMLTSETYSTRSSAKRAARRFMEGIIVARDWVVNRRLFE